MFLNGYLRLQVDSQGNEIRASKDTGGMMNNMLITTDPEEMKHVEGS